MKSSKETELWLVDILECIKYAVYDGGAGIVGFWSRVSSQYSNDVRHCGIAYECNWDCRTED